MVKEICGLCERCEHHVLVSQETNDRHDYMKKGQGFEYLHYCEKTGQKLYPHLMIVKCNKFWNVSEAKDPLHKKGWKHTERKQDEWKG